MFNNARTYFIVILKMNFLLLIFYFSFSACLSVDSSKILQKSETAENVNKPTNKSIINADQNANTPPTLNGNQEPDLYTIYKIKKNPYQTKPRRKQIKFPDDCTDIVPAGEKIRYLPMACAQTLKSIKPELMKATKDGICENSFAGLLAPEYAYPYEVIFYPFSTNKYLVKMRCSTGAYNEINVYLLYDESKIPAKAKILEFPSFDIEHDEDSDAAKNVEKVMVKTIGGRYFNPKTKKLIVFVKAHGIGDAGEYARYSFASGKPKLEEFRARFVWSGRGYQLSDVLKHPPKTWKRYYP